MPRVKANLDWASGFPEHFLSVLNAQAIGGLCRQLGIRPRGKPKLSVYQLLMVLVGHALAPSGNLAMHAHGLSGRRVSNAALSKRRRRLPWQVFERMMDWVLGPVAEAQQHPAAFWRGYRLVGLDGTMFSARNTPGILRALVKAASRRQGSAFAKLRVVMLVELGTHHPLAAVIGTAPQGELSLAYRLIEKVPAQSLLLADRLFGVGAFLVAFLDRWVQTERDFLVRVSSTPKVRILQRYADGSVLVQVTARHQGQRLELLVRQVHGIVHRRDGKRVEVRLWTSLLRPQAAPALELLRLYARRWEQEIAFQELKGQLQGGPLLDSQTVETAMQEIAALIVAQAVMARIRLEVGRARHGPVLQISFAQVREHVNAFWWMCQWFGDSTPEANIRRAAATMLNFLAEHASAPRRARSCPRAVRQPVTGWPRLLRNQSLGGEIHCEIIRKKSSKG